MFVRTFLGVWALGVAASSALGQVPLQVPLVVAQGEATIHGTPSSMVFLLERAVEGETLEECMTALEGMNMTLRDQLKAADLHPVNVDVRAPRIVSLSPPVAAVSAEVRFSAMSFAPDEEGARQVARTCDGMVNLADALDCEVSGPRFEAADSEQMIRSALAAATAEAYPKGDAVASTLNTAVYTVDTVEVVSVTWNDATAASPAMPTVRQVSCTARVKVTYTLATSES